MPPPGDRGDAFVFLCVGVIADLVHGESDVFTSLYVITVLSTDDAHLFGTLQKSKMANR